MTLENQYQLSFYKECAKIGDRDDIHLVQNTENHMFYVKKELTVYNIDVYRRMMQIKDVGIPRIYACIEDDGRLIVIEEYVHGNSLNNIMESHGGFDEVSVIAYMMRLCDAVRILHSQNPPIIHRDIKPSNIIISNEGNLKLIDINIAKPYAEMESQDTILIGTKEFAAPEQYGFRQSDARTDIYAIGVTMNYLLLKKVPREEMYRGYIGSIIEKCIEMDPKNRYQTIQELRTVLQNAYTNIYNSQQRQAVAQQSMAQQNKMPVNSGTDAQDISQEKTWRRFLPPGFRSGSIGKMIGAFIGYLIVVYLTVTCEFTSNNVPLVGARLFWERVMFFTTCLVCIIFAGDYLGIRKHLPLIKPENKSLKKTQIALYTILVGLAWMVVWILIEDMIW